MCQCLSYPQDNSRRVSTSLSNKTIVALLWEFNLSTFKTEIQSNSRTNIQITRNFKTSKGSLSSGRAGVACSWTEHEVDYFPQTSYHSGGQLIKGGHMRFKYADQRKPMNAPLGVFCVNGEYVLAFRSIVAMIVTSIFGFNALGPAEASSNLRRIAYYGNWDIYRKWLYLKES